MTDEELEAIKAQPATNWESRIYREPMVVLTQVQRDALVAEVERLRVALASALGDCDSLERGEPWWKAASAALHPEDAP